MIYARFFYGERRRLLCRFCRLTLIFWLLGGMLLTTPSAAAQQQKGLTLSLTNDRIEKAFDAIEAQTSYRVLSDQKLVSKSHLVSINVHDGSLEKVLQAVFKDQPFGYQLDGNQIIITPKPTISENKNQPQDSLKMISGTVTVHGIPLPGATVKAEGSANGTVTDEHGRFRLIDSHSKGYILVSYVGFYPKRIKLSPDSYGDMTIDLEEQKMNLKSVEVMSTGYQTLPKERATGSFSLISNAQFNRAVSTNFLDRLKGITAALVFDRTAGNQAGIAIRGRSTIFANTQPLIILDNFAFDGDFASINPNDIENVTILKDAAAASIWGARAGNGVIVVTTKKGSYNQAPSLSINSNVTVGEKPNLFYYPRMASADYAEVEKMLFEKGFYDYKINSSSRPPLTPVTEILLKQRNGELSEAEANQQINTLSQYDLRNDAEDHLYQKSVNQQYSVNLSGGNQKQKYYVSLGYDNIISNLIGNKNNRVSIDASNTYSFIKDRLELSTGLLYSESHSQANGLYYEQIPFGINNSLLYPYSRLADASGKPLPIAQYRQSYIDTAGSGKLQDWSYYPLIEVKNNDNNSTVKSYLLNLNLKYRLLKGLDIDLKYQYGKNDNQARQLNNLSNYSTRDYINRYSQINPATGEITYPIPLGGILNLGNSSSTIQNIRGQINYENDWRQKHHISGIMGAEIKDLNTQTVNNRMYGYDNTHATNIPVDYVTSFPNFVTGQTTKIDNNQSVYEYADRYVSYFGNAAYNYDDIYTLSVSARKDASNLIGVNINQKWAPFWSAGAAWNISNETFYQSKLLPYLKIRFTYGYNGNVDKTVSAYLTTAVSANNTFGLPSMVIRNPPNPDLRWEKTGMTNLGLDFALKGEILSGSIEIYRKSGKDLMGYGPLSPSSGLTEFKGNTGNMMGKGIDVTLNTMNLNRRFKWNTTILFASVTDKVTQYNVSTSTIAGYIYNTALMVGKPVLGIYSYRWGGLDAETGSPIGYLDKAQTQDYTGIVSSNDTEDLVYHGTATPKIFGSILNSFSWKSFNLSVNISYKLGYYFRRTSISYSALFNGSDRGHRDYARRWQQTGDEKITSVPSMIYPANPNRDLFYSYSDALIDKGDHIRLQDIKFSYDISQTRNKRLPFENINIYLYANNLGILWRKNKDHIDPEVGPSASYQVPRSISLGCKINL